MNAKMHVSLSLDAEQLHALLAQIEGAFQLSDERSREAIAEEIEHAAKDWNPRELHNDFDYPILKLAPVYCQLLAAWNAANGPEELGWTKGELLEAESLAEMIQALREARAAVAA